MSKDRQNSDSDDPSGHMTSYIPHRIFAGLVHRYSLAIIDDDEDEIRSFALARLDPAIFGFPGFLKFYKNGNNSNVSVYFSEEENFRPECVEKVFSFYSVLENEDWKIVSYQGFYSYFWIYAEAVENFVSKLIFKARIMKKYQLFR